MKHEQHGLFHNLPIDVTLVEVGPRDGFQFESKIIPARFKAEIITGLIEAGLKHIQVSSFVNPKKVPQMADAEKLLTMLPKTDEVTYSALALNKTGVERAQKAGLRHILVSISSSDAHSRKNTGMYLEEAVVEGMDMVDVAQKAGMEIRGDIQCAFGCVYEGEIPPERVIEIAGRYIDAGVDILSLSDTTGMATPKKMEKLLNRLKDRTGKAPLAIHLHDTRGLGLVNVLTALHCGVSIFDASLAGMGGCPFIAGASGNIATEDVAYLMHTLGIRTGVDIQKVAGCSQKMEQFFNKRFSGKMTHVMQQNGC